MTTCGKTLSEKWALRCLSIHRCPVARTYLRLHAWRWPARHPLLSMMHEMRGYLGRAGGCKIRKYLHTCRTKGLVRRGLEESRQKGKKAKKQKSL